MGVGSTHVEAIEAIYNTKMETKEFRAKYENLFDLFEEMDRELFTILLDKTEGEAFDKANSVMGMDFGRLSSFMLGFPGPLLVISGNNNGFKKRMIIR